jgi:hypothetical protein
MSSSEFALHICEQWLEPDEFLQLVGRLIQSALVEQLAAEAR